jgi:hypothetical protein
VDFAFLRDNFGNPLPAAAPAPALPAVIEPAAVAAAAVADPEIATVEALASRDVPFDDAQGKQAAPAVDLLALSEVEGLAELPSAAGYISGPQAMPSDLRTTTREFAATAEHDLRPLRDDPASDGASDDLLVDVLEDSYELLAAGF